MFRYYTNIPHKLGLMYVSEGVSHIPHPDPRSLNLNYVAWSKQNISHSLSSYTCHVYWFCAIHTYKPTTTQWRERRSFREIWGVRQVGVPGGEGRAMGNERIRGV